MEIAFYIAFAIYILKSFEEALRFAASDSGQVLSGVKGKLRFYFYGRLLLPTITWPLFSVWSCIKLLEVLYNRKEVKEEDEDLP